MSKFTKGPWIIRQTGPHWNNPELCNIEINYGTDTECVCDTVYEMADAHLIAAAPDLYEALENLLADRDYGPAIEAAFDALAKARGE